MMLRLLLVRHGETIWNTQRRYQGQTDVPLSDVGTRQAQFLAARLARESIDAVYSSDLQRAWQTARIVTQNSDLNVLPEPRLREMGFGVLEGLTFDEANSRFADIISTWLENYNQPPPGGEDMNVFSERVSAVLNDLQTKHDHQTILLVAHGGPLSELVRVVLGLSHTLRWAFLMNNAGLSEIQLDRGLPFLKYWNETCHLSELS
jgi:broad specificity phosphatase PhoE